MRKSLCIVIGLTIAATAASAASGQSPSPIQRIIAQENAKAVAKAAAAQRLQVSSPLKDGRSPDTKDELATMPKIDPMIVKYLQRYGYTLDQIKAFARPLGASKNVQSPPAVVVVGAGGFDWTDAGIGAAAVFAFFLLAAGGLTLMRDARRQRVHG
jgi:hypothetical protein